MAKIFNSADGILSVSMDYEIESRLMGLGAGITAYLNLFLYNKECNKVFRIRNTASRKVKCAVAGIPVMDSKKIQPLCEDATEVLFAELEDKLGKIVKKSDKKLQVFNASEEKPRQELRAAFLCPTTTAR